MGWTIANETNTAKQLPTKPYRMVSGIRVIKSVIDKIKFRFTSMSTLLIAFKTLLETFPINPKKPARLNILNGITIIDHFAPKNMETKYSVNSKIPVNNGIDKNNIYLKNFR